MTPVLTQDSPCLHTASMVNILVRDVPSAVHRKLVEKAESAGQSMQQYLLAELTHVAMRTRPRTSPRDMVARGQALREARQADLGHPLPTITAQEVADMIRRDRGDDLDEYGDGIE